MNAVTPGPVEDDALDRAGGLADQIAERKGSSPRRGARGGPLPDPAGTHGRPRTRSPPRSCSSARARRRNVAGAAWSVDGGSVPVLSDAAASGWSWALMFFPRGGSAQVVRYLARSLPDAGWDVTLVCGSLGPPGEPSNAETFFEGVDVRAARLHGARSRRPTRCAPTRPCSRRSRTARTRPTACSPRWTTRPTSTWSTPGSGSSREAGAADADVLHLNHLTPIHEAAERAFPDVPRDRPPARHRAADAARDRRGTAARAGTTPQEWAERMRALGAGAASGCSCSRPTRCGACPDLLGRRARARRVGAERLRPGRVRPPAADRRGARSRSGAAGSWRSRAAGTRRASPAASPTRDEDLEPFRDGGPVLLYVGPLHRGQAHPAPDPRVRARARALRPARAARAARRLSRASGRASTRWRWSRETGDRGRLPGRLARPRGPGRRAERRRRAWCCRRCASSSGQVLVEGMACGLPVIAVDAHGPADDRRRRGDRLARRRPTTRTRWSRRSWRRSNDDAERRRRGEAAYEAARARATRGPRWPSGWRASTSESRRGASPTAPAEAPAYV